MKKLLFVVIGLGLLSGCINPAPVASPIMVDEFMTGSEQFDNSVEMKKSGRSTAKHILIVGVGDASIRAAMQEGNIKKIHHVDHRCLNVLGIYMENETIVWGE